MKRRRNSGSSALPLVSAAFVGFGRVLRWTFDGPISADQKELPTLNVLLPCLLLAMVLLPLSACRTAPVPRAEPGWEDAARRRIREHRMGEFTVRLIDGDGRPVAGVPVTAEMKRHAFPFGSAISSAHLAQTRPGDPYRKHLRELFNRGTLENGYKWAQQERKKKRARADAATEWMLDHDMTIHAHVMIWATDKWGAVPEDVLEVVRSEDMSRGAKARYLRRRVLDRIETVGERYRGKVVEWDVLNEHYSEHIFTPILNPEAPLEEAPHLLEWFRAARAADPDARLFVNDYGIIVGDKKKHKRSYERLIEYLLAHEAPLGGIGMQAHYLNAFHRRSPQQLKRTLDRFGRFGMPIQITEFDMWGAGWGQTQEEAERTQAEFMREFYTVCFSHPAVNGITMWGLWDGRHWQDSAPLFREDWSPKPACEVYRDLVFDRWWTVETGDTDEEGRFTFRGFYGDYGLRFGCGPEHTVRLDEDGATVDLDAMCGDPVSGVF
jgi:GH35 family endo-1,4-beta-xylanase